MIAILEGTEVIAEVGRSAHFCLNYQVRLQPGRHHEGLVDICQASKGRKGLLGRKSSMNKDIAIQNSMTGYGVCYK